MFAGVRAERAIRNGHHHDRERVGEQAQRSGLAIRERTMQLVGRTLERYPVGTRAGVSLPTASSTAPNAAVVVREPAVQPKVIAGWNLKT